MSVHFWTGFIVGVFAASPLAFIVVGLCHAAARADERYGRRQPVGREET